MMFPVGVKPPEYRPAPPAFQAPLPQFKTYDSLRPMAGVRINPDPKKLGTGGAEERDRTRKSRPSPESPVWTVPGK
jgi:hypothetical protein